MKLNASNPLSQSNLAKGHVEVVLMQRKRVTVFSRGIRVTVTATCFVSFFVGGGDFFPHLTSSER